jgi:phosphate transport system permease protein
MSSPIFRNRVSSAFTAIFLAATVSALLILTVLLMTIINGAFGITAVHNQVEPEVLTGKGRTLEDLGKKELVGLLKDYLSPGLVRRLESEMPLDERTPGDLRDLVRSRIIDPVIIESWSLFDGIFKRGEIDEWFRQNPGSRREFRAWLNPRFLTEPQSSDPGKAGIRTALLGTLWVILTAFLFSFPVGIGAAVYMEEYAPDNRLNRLIRTNIYNLAGVPSIIYGLLGLAIFVRYLEPVTKGRTILSAGLTLGLLALPMIIISTQEALKALPDSLRQASLGLGATKWQMIRDQLLPAAMERILTGTILAMGRALGETAPLVVVGASTFIAIDPAGPFSKFTVLPIQIYQWTARPQPSFRHIAAAAIILLILLMVTVNMTAIILRYRLNKTKGNAR